MITYPISNRDLLRSIMATIPAAGVKYADPVLRKFVEDEEKGLCIMDIVKLPEKIETVKIYDPDGTSRDHTTTRQRHEVQVKYHDPELEFTVRLSI